MAKKYVRKVAEKKGPRHSPERWERHSDTLNQWFLQQEDKQYWKARAKTAKRLKKEGKSEREIRDHFRPDLVKYWDDIDKEIAEEKRVKARASKQTKATTK